MKDDTISRQAVLKLLSTIPAEEAITKAMLIQSVKQMDAAQPKSYREGYQAGFKDAQPEQKRGKWEPWRCDMYKCSECSCIYTELTDPHRCGANYCPNCGADMREVDDGSD